ncbi:MAG: hypothetical protein IKW01_05220 [Firmicutes bacterium]|nr:hypothetical protein [Bacillota bacterium]
MKYFLEEKFNIVADGSWTTTEILAAIIAALVILLLIAVIIKLIGILLQRMNPRKDTIFSHRKNKYKNRIGKKVKY